MKLPTTLQHNDDPRFYRHLGQLISSTGTATFAEQMHQLVNALVPIHGVDLCELTLDVQLASVKKTHPLGTAGLQHKTPVTRCAHPPLLQKVAQMEAPLLIEVRKPLNEQNPHRMIHQCNLVSSSGEQRWVICLYRLPTLRPFSLSELSLLKSLSDTLLPLVEHQAQLMANSVTGATSETRPELDIESASLHIAFSGRLAQDAINLSAREQEVCLGLLTGGTVPEMAQRLRVKTSSVETYLKRAAVKLGISGRHGLAKWMAGA